MLPEPHTASEVEALQDVLTKLQHVHYCEIIGEMEYPHSWSDVPIGLQLSILEFLQRQRLSQLTLMLLEDLPTTILLQCLDAAPTVSLLSVTASIGDIEPIRTPFVVQNLFLSSCGNIVELMTTPALVPRLSNIRKLWVDPDLECCNRLVSALGPQLEYVRFKATDPSIQPLQFMPFLRLATLAFYFSADLDPPWFLQRISSISIAPPPTLREICVSYHLRRTCGPPGHWHWHQH
ncbi:hypothetical protein DFH06DRAFT_447621 [Mycena polygramma]|nr:hypothetical protein DFH06DRAFT_533955 [Mycena polygramma]KAJ7658171.1 hypothetical protein DFH06DRAFT_447621 [Mycena polygramma]